MNTELKKKWISALRSGEYKQGRGFLHRIASNQFCCLGVLCDISPDIEKKENIDPDFTSYGFKDDRERSISSLPRRVRYSIGLVAETPVLIEMNDAGESFDTIADWIEENIPDD